MIFSENRFAYFRIMLELRQQMDHALMRRAVSRNGRNDDVDCRVGA